MSNILTLGAYLVAFAVLFLGLLNLLPTGSLPTEFSSAIAYIVGNMKAWNFLIPFDSLFYALIFVIGVDLAILGWWVIEWLIGLASKAPSS